MTSLSLSLSVALMENGLAEWQCVLCHCGSTSAVSYLDASASKTAVLRAKAAASESAAARKTVNN